MEDQSPTPPLSRPGSSVLTACDHELTSPPDLSPLSIASNDRVFKTENSHHFAIDLQHALNNVGPYPQSVEEELHRYIAIREIHPHSSYYETSPPQYFQLPTYQQAPSYVSYTSNPYHPLSSTPTTMPESSTINQFPRTYVWPTQSESQGPFGGRSDETNFTMSPEENEDDSLCDKPYARLIYDALMQAPGHRMMLREIYDWFQRHTNKPAESGTSGWQNSIRHNLSMNQAFENDKSDLANTSGQKHKVNSVWVLTENAIRNGVQSTTRYRKTGSGKRVTNNRIPAPLRQRSGAKGGKAARRAAQLRKKEHSVHQNQPSPSLPYPQTSMYDYEGSIYDGADSSDAFSALGPTTPLPDFSFGAETDYQSHRYAARMPTPPVCKPSASAYVGDPNQGMHDFDYQFASELTLEEMLRIYRDSAASNLST